MGTWRSLPLRTQDAGDINQDSVIDIIDALLMVKYWGSDKQAADFNFDGTVDKKDFELLAANFLKIDPGVKEVPKKTRKHNGKTLDDVKEMLDIS